MAGASEVRHIQLSTKVLTQQVLQRDVEPKIQVDLPVLILKLFADLFFPPSFTKVKKD